MNPSPQPTAPASRDTPAGAPRQGFQPVTVEVVGLLKLAAPHLISIADSYLPKFRAARSEPDRELLLKRFKIELDTLFGMFPDIAFAVPFVMSEPKRSEALLAKGHPGFLLHDSQWQYLNLQADDLSRLFTTARDHFIQGFLALGAVHRSTKNHTTSKTNP